MPGPPSLLGFVMTQMSRTAAFGLPQLMMGLTDPIVNQAKHVRTSGAELRAFLDSTGSWGDRPLDLGHTPITVFTAGVRPRIPGKSEAENKAIWDILNSLHDELVAASSSEIRKHEVVPGSSHYIHRTHPDVVVDAAKEMIARIMNGDAKR